MSLVRERTDLFLHVQHNKNNRYHVDLNQKQATNYHR